MCCVLEEKTNVNKTFYNSSLDLALEKFVLEDFSFDCWGVIRVKICLEIPYGALEYVLCNTLPI